MATTSIERRLNRLFLFLLSGRFLPICWFDITLLLDSRLAQACPLPGYPATREAIYKALNSLLAVMPVYWAMKPPSTGIGNPVT